MTDEQSTPTPDETPTTNGGDAWQEVGQQFKALGETLAATIRTVWQNEENRQRVKDVQHGMEQMVKDVGQAIKETAEKPQVRQVTEEAKKAANNLVDAGEQAVQEVRPHLLSALRKANDELQKFIERMQTSQPSASQPSEPLPPEPPAAQTPLE